MAPRRQNGGSPDLAAFAGKWVALSRNRVVAVGASLPDVMRKLPARAPRVRPSVFLVPRRDEGPYVLPVVLENAGSGLAFPHHHVRLRDLTLFSDVVS